jgi:signal transduction histidine kinase
MATERLSDAAGLTPAEQETRRRFLELTEEDARVLAGLKPWLQGEVDAIVEAFYDHLLRFPPLADMLSNPEVIRRLKGLQRQYFIELIDGVYDADYIERRLRVGQAHERTGLDPKWYLGAYNRYFRLAMDRIARAYAGDEARQHRALAALSKVLFLDIGLAIDAYILKAQQDLQRRADELAAINEIAASANATLDLLPVLNVGLERTLSAIQTEIGALLLLDESGRELVLKAHRGLSPSFAAGYARVPLGERVSGAVAQRGEPLIVDDIAADPRFRNEVVLREGHRAVMSVPLRARGRVIGALTVASRRPARFSPVDLRFMTSIADTLGIAVENARLYTATRQVAAVGELAASIAHEIKNPLAGISCALQVLAETSPAADARRPVIDEVLAQVRRLDRTVRDLLVFARPISPQPAPVSVAETAEWVRANIQSLPSFARVRVVQDIRPDAEQVSADPQLLRDVMLNLFLNAADAMPDGGTITVRSTREGPLVAVEVRDTGAGIPPGVRELLFRPFFTTKTRGTGLGLSICRKIVEAHGGRITVDSEVGRGTAILIHMPGA